VGETKGIVPTRRDIRLSGHNYATPGAYFVTICTFQRRCILGHIDGSAMYLNDVGRIVTEEWNRTGDLNRGLDLDAFVVMPNHLHAIIVLENQGRHLGAVVGRFKAAVTRRTTDGFWQRGYYDRIIRDERELAAFRQYIVDNPARWADDRENPAR